jgi:Flp pilus assembly protein TadB
MVGRPSTDEVLKKYESKLGGQVNAFDKGNLDVQEYSKSYQEFRKGIAQKYSGYEKWCKNVGNLVHIAASKKDTEKFQRYIDIAHLNITPDEAAGFSAMTFLLTFFLGFIGIISYWLLATEAGVQDFPSMLLFLFIMGSVFVYFYTYNYPQKLAIEWRLKASSQMVPAILYIVIYMKHTSNFEKAVAFAAQHLDEPLALDFRKVFWDVQVGRYSTVKDSVDHYLETWRDFSLEFIEAFHLIESSLYEPSESRRVAFLEKSLQVILDGVYEKMLKYTHNVKSPLTNIYMLGIVLPTLSLAILPLATTMMGGGIKWYHLFVVFNLLVPFFVLFMTNKVVLERPGGYGEASLLQKNPLYYLYDTNAPYIKAALICSPLFILGILPLLWMYTPLSTWLNLPLDPVWGSVGLGVLGKTTGMFGIKELDGVMIGPNGILSLLLSLLVPLSIALVFIIGNSERTKRLLVEREKYKEVEAEFTSSLFQLGNRLGDGMPPEIAFSKVLDSVKGTSTEGFFRLVNQNIQQLGMSVENALFNPKRGAIVFYPSHLIETSMRILIESSKKGLQVAARSLMSISDYVKNIRKIDERLTDLLADIISDMKSNMTFLAPLLSGIIVGLSGMITSILGTVTKATQAAAQGGSGSFGLGSALSLFGQGESMVSPYWIQVSIGLYLIEIIFILTSTLVIIKSGKDELEQTAEIGRNLKNGVGLYMVIALFSILGLSLLGAVVLQGFG